MGRTMVLVKFIRPPLLLSEEAMVDVSSAVVGGVGDELEMPAGSERGRDIMLPLQRAS